MSDTTGREIMMLWYKQLLNSGHVSCCRIGALLSNVWRCGDDCLRERIMNCVHDGRLLRAYRGSFRSGGRYRIVALINGLVQCLEVFDYEQCLSRP